MGQNRGRSHPLKRPGAQNDLDGAVVFLASESSRYITSQTMLVDGGISTGAMVATLAPNADEPHQKLEGQINP